MNLYHAMIDIKENAHALSIAKACDTWMTVLQNRGLIAGWQLMRRKFGLASGSHRDFILEIKVAGLAGLDDVFQAVGQIDEADMQSYERFHVMIAQVDVGLYRPFPDPAQGERTALV